MIFSCVTLLTVNYVSLCSVLKQTSRINKSNTLFITAGGTRSKFSFRVDPIIKIFHSEGFPGA